jgi:hypothetical protein
VHHLAFLPLWARIIAACALLALAPPPVARRLGAAVGAAGSRITGPIVALIAVLAAVAFYVARLQTQFLGDGAVWQSKLAQDIPFWHYDPLAAALVGSLARRLDPAQPHTAAGLPAICLGALYVVATWWLCTSIWKNPKLWATVWVLLVAHPAVLLFFGYVESYPFLLVQQVLLLAAMVAAVRDVRWMGLVVLLGGVAIASHLSAVAWLPAVAAVPIAARRTRGVGGCDVLVAIAAVVGAIVIAALISDAVGVPPGAMLGQLAGDITGSWGAQDGWFLSFDHLVDVVNESLLLLGPGLVLLAAGLIGASRREWLRDPRWMPVAAMVPGPLLMSWTVRPLIGGARDWDLFATIAIPTLLLSAHAWSLLSSRTEEPGAHSIRSAADAAGGWAIGLALAWTLSWLAVNLDESRAATRLYVLQDPRGPLGGAARGSANEMLALYYQRFDLLAARASWKRAIETNPTHPRYHRGLARVEQRVGSRDRALQAWRRVQELVPGDVEAQRMIETLERGP